MFRFRYVLFRFSGLVSFRKLQLVSVSFLFGFVSTSLPGFPPTHSTELERERERVVYCQVVVLVDESSATVVYPRSDQSSTCGLLNYYNNKIQQRLDKLKRLLPTTLLSTIQTIADKRADKTAEQHRAKTKQKLTRLQDTKNAKRRKPDANWVRNISSRPLDETETQVLSYGLKHSVTPKQIPTEAIVSSVEAVLSRQHELSESTKDNIRSRATSTLQSASLPNSRKKSRKHLND